MMRQAGSVGSQVAVTFTCTHQPGQASALQPPSAAHSRLERDGDVVALALFPPNRRADVLARKAATGERVFVAWVTL
jgi:hypothetical protein